MARAADRYRLPVQRREYYSLRVRASTARLLCAVGVDCGMSLTASWDSRLLSLATIAHSWSRRAQLPPRRSKGRVKHGQA